MFQSLIGTLQTHNFEGIDKNMGVVSIPYRYATNNAFFGDFLGYMAVSIPYRYATNYILCFAYVSVLVVSIPYRYATNK